MQRPFSFSAAFNMDSALPAPMHLLDLLPELLLYIFKLVPLHDKLHSLSQIPQFQPYLHDRGAYVDSPLPFSPLYLRLLRLLRPGWYMARQNWSHRFLLSIDPGTLHFTLHHFLLECHPSLYRSEPKRECTLSEPIDRMARNVTFYMTDYVCLDNLTLLAYHLRGYGFLLLDHSFQGNVQNLRFYDWTRCTLETNVPRDLLNRFAVASHFRVTLTPDRTLVVECTLPECPCPERIQHLTPFSFQLGQDCLTWPGGDPIRLAAHQDFELTEGGDVKGQITSYVQYPFKISMHHELGLKRLKRVALERAFPF